MQPGILSGPAALRGLILDRVFLTLAGDRQSVWSLGGVDSFCAGVSFCISNHEYKWLSASERDVSSSQACGGGL